MIEPIRPKVLFQLIEDHFPSRNNSFKVNIPSPDIGGMTLLESSVLVCLAKLTNSISLFEFGTFMGATTLLLAENTPEDARIVTLDIEQSDADLLARGLPVKGKERDQAVLKDGDTNDDFLRDVFNREGARCIRRADEATRTKITQMYKNSLLIDPHKDALASRFDFVFIDGGHDYDTIKADTANAYQMATPDAVVAWHDYDSKIHGDVTRFLADHSAGRRIFHVQNTMIAFELLGHHAKLIPAQNA